MKGVKQLVCGLAIGAAVTAIALAQHEGGKQPAQPEFKLPEGWTMEDMQQMMAAGTPGEHHQLLQKMVGVWDAHTQMWIGPGGEAVPGVMTWTMTSMYDGRYIKTDVSGEMPGMGPFIGTGYTGYDNVAGTYVATWIDSHSSGILPGKGTLSADGKTMQWTYDYHCPLTKKMTAFRHVEKFHDDGTMTVDMFGIDPKSGKEYKMMNVELKKKS